jgi:protein-L-isoaspartate(D-aspartate) O-methyltransferase
VVQAVEIEIWPDLAGRAQRNLAAQGIGNVVVLVGDGTEGAPGHAPFDAIVVCAAFPRVPPPLAAQLITGGRLIQPVGPGGAEQVVLYEKDEQGLRRVRVLTRRASSASMAGTASPSRQMSLEASAGGGPAWGFHGG